MDKEKILQEMVDFIDDYVNELPSWTYDEAFTTEEFGDEMLSIQSWWEKKKKQLSE